MTLPGDGDEAYVKTLHLFLLRACGGSPAAGLGIFNVASRASPATVSREESKLPIASAALYVLCTRYRQAEESASRALATAWAGQKLIVHICVSQPCRHSRNIRTALAGMFQVQKSRVHFQGRSTRDEPSLPGREEAWE